MAISSTTINWDYLTTMFRDKILPQTVDNVIERSAFAMMLLSSGRNISAEGKMSSAVNGGQNIIQRLRYARGTAVSKVTGHEPFDITPADTRTAAVYPFSEMYVAATNISFSDELAVSGDAAVTNLLAEEAVNTEDTLVDAIANDLYTGTSAIVGLDSAIGTATYGNIAGATYSWWQSGVDTTAHLAADMADPTSTTSYLPKLLANGWASTSHNGEHPDFVLMSQAVWDIAEEIANNAGQFTTPTSGLALRMADLGYTTLQWRGIPLVVDTYINTTSYPMYMGNTNYLALYYHPQNNFKLHDWVTPANQLARINKVTATLQLAINNRRMFYRWTDLNN